MKNDPLVNLNTIAQIIFDKKGMNILALDLRGVSTITDFAIIAEGTVDRHVSAITHAVETAMEELGERTVYKEGLETGDWAVLDYVQIMVHIFMPGIREKYRLEELWKKGKIVDLNINVSSEEPMAYISKRRK